jgi:lipopolysaccharide export system permease protein
MKKIDRLVLGSFVGPFFLTLVVVDFILLLAGLIRYFDELFGKGLSFATYAELFTYFAVSSSPDAFPLAVLLSSIMAFGNLGEHSELTAIKSAGISLVRALMPIFFFVLIITGVTYYANTRLVPKVNLKTYSLLWDMRTKKPALDIKEGVFYDGIPGYSIKVNEKVTDEHLRDIIIYDHTGDNAQSNKKVVLADSGRMYSFMNQRYLALELFDGIRYEEQMENNFVSKRDGGQFVRDRFESSKMVFDLSSFDMGNTDEQAFSRSRLVQTRRELADGLDSMQRDILLKKERMFTQVTRTFLFHFLSEADLPDVLQTDKAFYDSLRELRIAERKKTAQEEAEKEERLNDSIASLTESVVTLEQAENELATLSRAKDTPQTEAERALAAAEKQKAEEEFKQKHLTPDDVYKEFLFYYNGGVETSNQIRMQTAINFGINQTRQARNIIDTRLKTIDTVESYQRRYTLTRNQQMARSFACLIMFLIGAPIGAIIKKGGLGMPLIVSIIFFLIFYIFNTLGEKWGRQDVVDPSIAVWISSIVLLPFGLFFLKQARNDARLFESDFYTGLVSRFKKLMKRN